MYFFFESHNDKIQYKSATIDGDFYTSGKKKIDYVLVEVEVPFTTRTGFFFSYKQSKRKENDQAIVNSAFFVDFIENTKVIKTLRMAFGGVEKTTKLARCAEKFSGRAWDEDLLKEVLL